MASMDAIRQQGTDKQGAIAQDIKQLSAADTQPNGEHDDDNEQVQQQQGRNQQACLR
jgi:hypothetical protein